MMDRETAIRIWRELPGGDIVTGSTLKCFAEKVEAAECERCKNLAGLAVSYAKDADWSRVDAVLGLL